MAQINADLVHEFPVPAAKVVSIAPQLLGTVQVEPPNAKDLERARGYREG